MEIVKILETAMAQKVSDIFIVSGCPISFKKGAEIRRIDETNLTPADTSDIIDQIYALQSTGSYDRLIKSGDDDFSFSVQGMGRFRCNAYKQRNSLAAVLRVVNLSLPDYKEFGIPESVIDLYSSPKGLILITGPAGCGKSTTAAMIIDKINKYRNTNIVTIEDPIEYLYRHDKSIVSQREVSLDTMSFHKALSAALRQAPDVIFLSAMPDVETIQLALNAAETGQLVISNMHTNGVANSIERLVEMFPVESQQQVRMRLSMIIEAVVSQQLIPTVDGGLTPVFEVMKVNPAIRNLIKEGKAQQIENVIIANVDVGMMTMDSGLLKLLRNGIITRKNALLYCTNHEMMLRKIAEM